MHKSLVGTFENAHGRVVTSRLEGYSGSHRYSCQTDTIGRPKPDIRASGERYATFHGSINPCRAPTVRSAWTGADAVPIVVTKPSAFAGHLGAHVLDSRKKKLQDRRSIGLVVARTSGSLGHLSDWKTDDGRRKRLAWVSWEKR